MLRDKCLIQHNKLHQSTLELAKNCLVNEMAVGCANFHGPQAVLSLIVMANVGNISQANDSNE